jgi:hypothetical protein
MFGMEAGVAKAVTPDAQLDIPIPDERPDWRSSSDARECFSTISSDSGAVVGTITFEDNPDGPVGLTLAQCMSLRTAIGGEIARLDQWSSDQGWRHTWPLLHVVVADRFRISKSLVPAWNGLGGRMELPTWRVAGGKAAILHELVHVLFPNANRFMAEGLAIYLQAKIGGNPAFPNFGRPLHDVARDVLQELKLLSSECERVDEGLLTQLDAIATPEPLTLRIGAHVFGEEPRGQGRIYPLVGSFAQYLIEAYSLTQFHTLFDQTPLVPLSQNAGLADRWTHVYGRSLADLESDWKVMSLR